MLSFTGENLSSRTRLGESTPKKVAKTEAEKFSGFLAKRNRKPRRVLYPPQVRRYLPRQETDSVKRWLLFLAVVIIIQIFTEDPEQDRVGGGKDLSEHQPWFSATVDVSLCLQYKPVSSLRQVIPLNPSHFSMGLFLNSHRPLCCISAGLCSPKE
uniref:Radiation-inducible immediate-early gene IEX-1 n=1 Tax=Pelusios castaneus TaxID=367368 RepID=A0A8C8T127_9SAUR